MSGIIIAAWKAVSTAVLLIVRTVAVRRYWNVATDALVFDPPAATFPNAAISMCVTLDNGIGILIPVLFHVARCVKAII